MIFLLIIQGWSSLLRAKYFLKYDKYPIIVSFKQISTMPIKSKSMITQKQHISLKFLLTLFIYNRMIILLQMCRWMFMMKKDKFINELALIRVYINNN